MSEEGELGFQGAALLAAITMIGSIWVGYLAHQQGMRREGIALAALAAIGLIVLVVVNL